MEFYSVSLASFCAFVAIILNLATVFASMEDMARNPPTSSSVQPVDIKPGAGQQEVSEKLGNFVCKFQYRAQGGTNEEWSLSISANKATKEWLCTIERPLGNTYLFFEEFKLHVSGARLQEVRLEKEPGVVLSDGEYIVHQKENSVQDIPGKFNSQLSKAQIYATRPTKVKRHL